MTRAPALKWVAMYRVEERTAYIYYGTSTFSTGRCTDTFYYVRSSGQVFERTPYSPARTVSATYLKGLSDLKLVSELESLLLGYPPPPKLKNPSHQTAQVIRKMPNTGRR